MKKSIFMLLFCFIGYIGQSQYKNSVENHQISIDFGSFRNRYLFPINDIRYSSPVFSKLNLRLSARIRSYGTLYFYSKIAYDITPIAEYFFNKTIKTVYFSVGAGMDTRIRLVRDERSHERSSAEPLISLAIHGNHKRLSWTAPLWTRFYSNGIAFTLMPELSYSLNHRFAVFFRYEASILNIYKVSPSEYRQDIFIGGSVLF